MQGTVLIVEGIPTNRIMLRVQLSAAYYHVVQTDRLDGILSLIRQTQPDLIVTAMSLPDGNALSLREMLKGANSLPDIPIVAITAENDRGARIAALEAGINDVLSHPLDDLMLQARIRNLLRVKSGDDDLPNTDTRPGLFGFGESHASFSSPARIVLMTRDVSRGQSWKAKLKDLFGHTTTIATETDPHSLLARPAADAYVIETPDEPQRTHQSLLAELKARSATRNAALIAVVDPASSDKAADALDRGANDVLQDGFCARELALRLKAQLQHKANTDNRRASVRDSLRAAVTDPMTGLYNRRYALPHLSRTMSESLESGEQFAVMLADLDHFKNINDTYGHPVGDAVLVEVAARLRKRLRSSDMVARIGGEEFMIIVPNTNQCQAVSAADRLCRQINSRPFWVPGASCGIPVTISIGVAVGGCGSEAGQNHVNTAESLIKCADRALYEAKDAGRNKVTLHRQSAA